MMTQPSSFDLVYHLAGEQIIPNYIGIAQCPAKRHVLIASKKTAFVHERLASFDRLKDVSLEVCIVDAYDVRAIMAVVHAHVSANQGRKIAFNLTGGTKPMFAAVYQICRDLGATAFYVETTGRTLDFLTPSFERQPLKAPFVSVEDFVHLSGFKVLDSGKWEHDPRRDERTTLTTACWRNKHLLMDAKLQKQIQPWITEDPFGKPFAVSEGRVSASLDKDSRGKVAFDDEQFVFPSFGDLAAYLGGRWFEEYCYIQLRLRFAESHINDLRIGLKPDWGDTHTRDGAQEFDLCFTNGFILTILECKAGFVRQVDFQKLENLAERFGGTFGRGILLSPFPPSNSIRRRIQASRSVAGIFGTQVDNIAKLVSNIAPGTCARKHH